MRYRDLHRLYAATPVTSSAPPRREAPSQAPIGPSVGARWGRKSAFSWSREEPADQTGVSVEYPEQAPPAFMRVISADAKIMSQRVRVEAPGDPSNWIEVDRMTRIAFAFTEFPPKATVGSLQPSSIEHLDRTAIHNALASVPMRTAFRYRRDSVLGRVGAHEQVITVDTVQRRMRISIPLAGDDRTPAFELL